MRLLPPARTAALVSVVALVPLARAQESMSFAVQLFDTDGNANGIVEPGERVGLRVRATITPGIGGAAVWNNYPGATGAAATVYGFAASIINVMGVQNGGTGTLAYSVPPELAVPVVPQFIAASQSVLGSNAGQLVHLPSQPGNTGNPIVVFEGTWTPTNYTQRTLGYGVLPTSGAIYLDAGLGQPVAEWTQNTSSQATIQIVPGPAGTVLLVLGIGAAGGRRRRR